MSFVVILSTALVVGIVVAVLLRDGHPENGCSHGDHPNLSESEQFYSQADRPAGPDAEDASLERDAPPPRETHGDADSFNLEDEVGEQSAIGKPKLAPGSASRSARSSLTLAETHMVRRSSLPSSGWRNRAGVGLHAVSGSFEWVPVDCVVYEAGWRGGPRFAAMTPRCGRRCLWTPRLPLWMYRAASETKREQL